MNGQGKQDKKIREHLEKRDIDFQDQLKSEMKKEEDQLRGYFQQFKKPVSKDPTVIKKSQTNAQNRLLFLKQALKPFQLFQSFYQFWTMQCQSKEEEITMKLCRKNMLKNMSIGIGFSLLITGLTSMKFRGILPTKIHIFGLLTGIISGGLYGAITSTKFTLQQFQRLGHGYELGRIAHSEIERYRMDRPLKSSQLY